MQGMTKFGFLLKLSLGAVFMAAATAAEAGTLTCNVPLPGDENRQIVVEWTSPGGSGACVDSGTGNAPNDDPYSYLGTDYPLLDKDCLGVGDCGSIEALAGVGDSGTFEIFGLPGTYLIAFKFGGGGNPDPEPDWWIVALTGVLEGTYNLTGEGNNALSHANLWGDPGDPPQIPEPATLLLFGSGLVGAAAARRRAKKA